MFGWRSSSKTPAQPAQRSNSQASLPTDLADTDDIHIDEGDFDENDPELLAELLALTVTSYPPTSQSAPVKNKPAPVAKTSPKVDEADVSKIVAEIGAGEDVPDAQVEVTEDDLNNEHLMRELYELTGHHVEHLPSVPMHLDEPSNDPASETEPNDEAPTDDHHSAEAFRERQSEEPVAPEEDDEDVLPLAEKLKTTNVQVLEKYVQLEKVKAAMKNRVGDKAGAKESFLAYKQLETRLRELAANPVSSNAAQQRAAQKSEKQLPPIIRQLSTADQEQVLKLKRAALAYRKTGNMEKAREALQQAKAIESPSAAAASTPSTIIRHKPIPVLPPTVTADNIISPTDDPVKVFNHIIEQLRRQVDACTTIASEHLKSGNKELAVQFHQHKKNFAADLASLESRMLAKSSVPNYHYTSVTYSMNRTFLDLSMQDLQVDIIRGIGLTCKDVNSAALETFVTWEFGWPTTNDGSATTDTPVAKKTMNPDYAYSKVIKIDRTKSFQRFLERKKATFEVFHYRGFLRKSLSLGKAIVKLDDLLQKSEINECFDLVDASTRKPSGGKLELRLRLRQPLVGIDTITKSEKWIVIDDFNLEVNYSSLTGVASTSPNTVRSKTAAKAPVSPATATRLSIASPNISPKAVHKPVASASSEPAPTESGDLDDLILQFNNIDLMVSNNVLESEQTSIDTLITQHTVKHTPVPDELSDKKSQLSIKIQLLMLQVQSGRLTLPMYLETVGKSSADTKKLALAFRKAGSLEYAKRCLMRSKIMDDEVSEAQASLEE